MLRVETCQSSIVGRRTNTIGYLRWRLDLVHRQVAAIATPGKHTSSARGQSGNDNHPNRFGIGSDRVKLGSWPA
jgi:hypothetical protein